MLLSSVRGGNSHLRWYGCSIRVVDPPLHLSSPKFTWVLVEGQTWGTTCSSSRLSNWLASSQVLPGPAPFIFSHPFSCSTWPTASCTESSVLGEINPPRPPQLPPCSDRSTDLANVNFNSTPIFPCCGRHCPGDESPVKATRCPQQMKRSVPESGAFTLLQEPISSCGLWRMLLPEQSSLPKSSCQHKCERDGHGRQLSEAPGQREYELWNSRQTSIETFKGTEKYRPIRWQ